MAIQSKDKSGKYPAEVEPISYFDRRAARLKFWRNVVLGVLAFVGFILYWGFKPMTGDMHYGICRVFLERKYNYPKTIRISEVDWYKEEQRIFYTVMEPFGSTLSGVIRCKFAPPKPSSPYIIGEISVNKQPVSAEDIAAFNKTIPIILKYPPDLKIPGRGATDLKGLKLSD